MKDKFAVVCHRVDCEDEETFLLDGAECCETIAEARKLMKEDFKNIREEYSPEWSADGKTDHCTLKNIKMEFVFISQFGIVRTKKKVGLCVIGRL